MSIKSEKMAVFLLLQKQIRPISLPELLQLLDSRYPERTVRRWLAEMIEENLVTKSGQKRGTRYQIKSMTNEPANCFSAESHSILQQLEKPLFERKLCTYDPRWLEAYHPNQTFYLNTSLQAQLYEAGGKKQIDLPAGTYAHHIYHRLLIDLSYNSSRLEGNTYSLLDTQRLLLEGTSAENKLDEEKVMILNHKEAITYLVNHASKLTININEICTLHYLLAEGLIPAQHAGKIRDHGVRISGSTYIPWENQEKIKAQLEQICQKASLIQNPFEQSLFLLAQIAYLQAFIDVNKRTSRLSANIPLIKNNLIPLSFNDVDKDDYTSAMLAIYEFNQVGPLVDLYVHSYLRTCQLYSITTDILSFDEVRIRYRQPRRELVRYIISHYLIGDAIDDLIKTRAQEQIPEKDRALFIEDVTEDLNQISPARLAGFGITAEELNRWLTLQQSD